MRKQNRLRIESGTPRLYSVVLPLRETTDPACSAGTRWPKLVKQFRLGEFPWRDESPDHPFPALQPLAISESAATIPDRQSSRSTSRSDLPELDCRKNLGCRLQPQ